VPYNAFMMKSPSSQESPRATTAEPQLSLPLTPKGLRALRARAHALKPVVWIASGGATEGVVRELDRALAVHELVKMHAAIDDREERGRLLRSLCQTLGAEPVQTIGKMLVAFRPRPPVERPASAPRMRGKPGKAGSSKVPAQRKQTAARSRKLSVAPLRRVPNRSR
jgi:RNA-binding protein